MGSRPTNADGGRRVAAMLAPEGLRRRLTLRVREAAGDRFHIRRTNTRWAGHLLQKCALGGLEMMRALRAAFFGKRGTRLCERHASRTDVGAGCATSPADARCLNWYGGQSRAVLDESDFFTFLEYRVCDELPVLDRKEILGLWCDGLSPEGDEMLNGRCTIHGEAWMGGVPGRPRGAAYQESWRFHAALPQGVVRSADLDWQPFCPPVDATGWLEVEPDECSLTIWLSRWSAPVG